MLKDIKKVLGIEDDLQDEVLDILMNSVENHLKALLGKDVPESLKFIVQEITIRRFNRIGTEGMQSESVEGHSITFYDLDDEFKPYLTIIYNERDDDEDGYGRGRVLFI